MDQVQYHVQKMEHLVLLQHVSVSVFYFYFSNLFSTFSQCKLSCDWHSPILWKKLFWTILLISILKCSLPAVVRCEDPNIANGHQVDGSRPPHGYRSTVTYECISGYVMEGGRTLTCGIDSQWSPGLPTCQSKSLIEITTWCKSVKKSQPVRFDHDENMISILIQMPSHCKQHRIYFRQ